MRYCGVIGFAETVETEPGVMEDTIVERKYYGIVKRVIQRQTHAIPNPDLEIDNELVILSDAYARNHIDKMRYISWMGNNWIIKTVEVSYPRITLWIGGLYNVNATDSASGRT